MNERQLISEPNEPVERPTNRQRHPLTLENSPEETIKRLRFLPERAAKLREAMRALRETHSR